MRGVVTPFQCRPQFLPALLEAGDVLAAQDDQPVLAEGFRNASALLTLE